MELGALNEVKAILKSLVLSSPDRMTIEVLNRDYRGIEGEFIPFRRLGFDNLENFLRSIPDTLMVVGSGYSACVYFVSNEKTKHVHDMIMKQKKPKIRLRGKPMNSRLGHSNTSEAVQKSGRHNNNCEAVKQVRRMPGQQFSPFQTTNRNVSVRTISVRDVPKFKTPERASNNWRTIRASPVSNPLPHPNGIVISLSANDNDHKMDKQKSREITQSHKTPSKEGRKSPLQGNTEIKAYSRKEIKDHNAEDGKEIKQNTKTNSNYNINKEHKTIESNHNLQNLNSQTKPFYERETRKNTTLKSPDRKQNPIIQSVPTNQSSTSYKPLNKTLIFENKYCPDIPSLIENKSTKKQSEESKDPHTYNKFQEDIKQLENLLNTTCHVSAPDVVPVVKSVSFSPDVQITDIACGGMTDETLNKILPRKFLRRNEFPKHQMGKTKSHTTEDETTDEGLNRKSKDLFDIKNESLVDFDEAVPKFAANNQVFRIDFPKHTVTYGRKIPKCKLPDNIKVGSYIRIFIAEIHNPFKFWFHIHKDDNELDTLMNQIERFYSPLPPNELRIPIMCLNPGQICAASFNKLWHRAEIISPPVDNKIKVSFIDYGTVSEVNIMEIKYLTSNFAQLPAQAVRGSLSHIKPRGLHWSHEATLHFLHLVSEKMLYAKITEIDTENSTCHMILCDTHNEEVKQINGELVQKRYALYNKDWDESKITKNNGHRMHHPREDFPTFSMLESGEYPNFTELVQLSQRGIDYEMIYDRIVYNKWATLNYKDNVPEPIKNLPFNLLKTNPFRTDILFELTGIKVTL